MTDIVLSKAPNGALIPVDQQGIDYILTMKVGAGVSVTIKKNNNLAFHRKLFALLNFAFDNWEVEAKEYKGMKVEKNFDQFRKDLTILAGYYDAHINFKGDVRLTAKSLSFGTMDDDEKEKLYSSIINVVLSKILTKYTREDIDQVVETLLNFS